MSASYIPVVTPASRSTARRDALDCRHHRAGRHPRCCSSHTAGGLAGPQAFGLLPLAVMTLLAGGLGLLMIFLRICPRHPPLRLNLPSCTSAVSVTCPLARRYCRPTRWLDTHVRLRPLLGAPNADCIASGEPGGQAAIAGIIFGVLLITALTMVRIALAEGITPESLQTDAQRRTLTDSVSTSSRFAGIAFLWFIGVIREQIGQVEDRLFSTVFLGSGLLFLAMMFAGAVTSTSMIGCCSARTSTSISGRTDGRRRRHSFRCPRCGWRRCSPFP